ncbi:OsmC family protein [Microbacterium sp. ARD31]|uniref:OsmC family protein n=1 Tax=Microbacterium sp. ARD31 TaxID=2962576 RepID=UPI0028826846|nr:OsmC family protein [Microbacterium sp. ARD31]MDT0186535.1 OsmC family protein [Microbacterium sp. ARD31]
MSTAGFEVRVAAGSRAGDVTAAYVVPHAWTDGGIAVEGGGTGAHLLLTAIGCCVLNDVLREAAPMDVAVDGVLVEVSGDFDTTTWSSTAVTYGVVVDSRASAAQVDALVAKVADVAEIPRAVGGEVTVTRR